MHTAGMTVEEVSDLGGGRWLVKGNYDIQKPGDAVNHESYSCTMEHIGAGRFTVRSLGMTIVLRRP